MGGNERGYTGVDTRSSLFAHSTRNLLIISIFSSSNHSYTQQWHGDLLLKKKNLDISLDTFISENSNINCEENNNNL